jgi:hypothetical protein
LDVVGEYVCDLQVFLNIGQMSVCVVHAFCFFFVVLFLQKIGMQNM